MEVNKFFEGATRLDIPHIPCCGYALFSCPVLTLSLNPVMLVGLLVRQSRGEHVPSSIFVRLREMVFDKIRYLFY
jgi:hypothetical protein